MSRYATNLRLSEDVLNYIAIRINNARPINALDLCYEIRERFNESYLYLNFSSGRPKVYSDICMLFCRLVENKSGYFLKYSIAEIVYCGDIYF
ncbi:DUF3895 domain-containing protein [Macrococcus armenti]|nr:DUF3895 domain-containing protein [Macrococcus armenti]